MASHLLLSYIPPINYACSVQGHHFRRSALPAPAPTAHTHTLYLHFYLHCTADGRLYGLQRWPATVLKANLKKGVGLKESPMLRVRYLSAVVMTVLYEEGSSRRIRMR